MHHFEKTQEKFDEIETQYHFDQPVWIFRGSMDANVYVGTIKILDKIFDNMYLCLLEEANHRFRRSCFVKINSDDDVKNGKHRVELKVVTFY